jgi:hypothetical protein
LDPAAVPACSPSCLPLAPRWPRGSLCFAQLQGSQRDVNSALLGTDLFDRVDSPEVFLLVADPRAQGECAPCIIDPIERRFRDSQNIPSTADRLLMFETHTDTCRQRD